LKAERVLKSGFAVKFMTDFYMKKCIETAGKSDMDIPVGCAVVREGEIISLCHNEKEALNSVSAHAEILALNETAKKLGSWRLEGCDLYVTLEPCPMCAWAILNSRIKNVYFGAFDTKYGAFGGALNLAHYGNFETNIFGGIMEKECENLLKEYFKSIRK